MDLESQAQIIGNIRETLAGYVGKTLHVHANMGRSKVIESEGELMQVHPQLFIMEVKRKRGASARQSYQYVDILTGMVKLYYEGESIFVDDFIDDGQEEEAPAILSSEAILED